MPPIIHLVRHAQGLHNLHSNNHYIHDPDLTELGEQQCLELQKAALFPHDQIDLIVSSPLKRTIRTALIAFGEPLRAKSLKVICLQGLQETSALPCDTGTPRDQLELEFKGQPVDFSYVTPGWDCKVGRWAPDAEAIEMRARQVRLWLRDRPEKEIVCVTHAGFLHYLTENWSEHDQFTGTGWANTEWRSVYFTSDSPSDGTSIDHEDNLAHVKELPESQQRRRNMARPPLAKEQEGTKSTEGQFENLNADHVGGSSNSQVPPSSLHAPRSRGNSHASQPMVQVAVS